jgi:hypothetical protein
LGKLPQPVRNTRSTAFSRAAVPTPSAATLAPVRLY